MTSMTLSSCFWFLRTTKTVKHFDSFLGPFRLYNFPKTQSQGHENAYFYYRKKIENKETWKLTY